jgi:PilZ domain
MGDTFVPEAQEDTTFQRTRLYLPGQIFDPLNEETADCKVLHLWAGGADIQCTASFPPGASLVLYINGFGRFEGHAIPRCDGEIELEFTIREAKRDRLIEKLASFAKGGLLGVTELRKHQRLPSLATGKITLQNGEEVACEVLDLSLDGVSLKTKERPPVGEIVKLGRSYGRVTRQHNDGIAVQYVKVQDEKLPEPK